MATLILRPISDISLQHNCSAGNSGYSMISESNSDSDSTYIVQNVTASQSTTQTSIFALGAGNMPSGSFIINSMTLHLFARATSTSTGARSGNFKLTNGSYSQTITYNTSYRESINQRANEGLFELGSTYTANDISNLQVEISTSGNTATSTGTKQAETFENRVTQVYLEIEYEEVIEDTTGIYLKQNGQWVEYTQAYKKINGVWQLQDDLSSVFDENTNYVKGN